MGTSLAGCWNALRVEVAADDGDGPLALPAARAGEGIDAMQKALTCQREAARFQYLDVTIRALPEGDMRRATWQNLDQFSTVWVSCCPSADCRFANDEFAEVAARYFALPSPACA